MNDSKKKDKEQEKKKNQTNTTENINKIHSVILKLIYPGILGSIIYSVFEKISVDNFFTLQNFLALLIVCTYIMDFIYTDQKNIELDYNLGMALFDFLIVLTLFISVHNLYQANTFAEVDIALLLAASKFFGLLWELCRNIKDYFAMTTFTVFCIAYLAASLISAWVTLFVLIVDVCMFCFYGNIKKGLDIFESEPIKIRT